MLDGFGAGIQFRGVMPSKVLNGLFLRTRAPSCTVRPALVAFLIILLQCSFSSLAAPTLADGLDAPTLVWQTGGDAAWFAEISVTHDGSDAAQSGTIADSQESCVQTTVTGPGTLSFWWKASSELGYDELQFLIDEVEQVNISGEVTWQPRSFDLASGAHVIKWRYAKDFSGSSGSDQAWLDQVSFTPTGNSAPVILVQPASQIVGAGATASLSVMVSGMPTPAFHWRFNGALIPQGTNSTLTLYNVTTNQGGAYTVVVSNYLGSVTSAPAVLTITSVGDALDAAELAWMVGGDAPWFGQSLVTYDGIDALQSGAITNNQESWVQTVVTGPGMVSFWWKVSSEPQYDGLQFLIDGVAAASLSGEALWEQQTFSLSRGPHALRWRYFKDSSISLGQDTSWLDEVVYIPNKPPSGLALSLSRPQINEGDSVTVTGSFLDPDASDLHTVVLNWGDGSKPTTNFLDAGMVTFGVTHQYVDDNPTGTPSDTNLIRVTVSDQVGSTTVSIPLRINNVVPVLSNVAITSPIFPYDAATVTGNISDAGVRDTFTLSVNWGDGSSVEAFSYGAGTNSFSLRHYFALADTNLAVTLTLADDDTGSVSVTFHVIIRPVPAPAQTLSLRPAASSSNVLLQFQGTAQANYQIQASEDLKHWETIALRTAGANGLFQIEDSQRLLHGKRFYRTLWQSQSPGGHFESISKLANGHISVRLRGFPGTAYRIETSANLTDWSVLAIRSADSKGSMDVEDVVPTSFKRFYRAVIP